MMMKTMKSIAIALCCIFLVISCAQATQINTGDGTIRMSSGDNATITGSMGNMSKHGHIWLYTGDYSNLIYGDKPINVTNRNTTYDYEATIDKSLNLKPGKYRVFIQFDGNNDVQEVLYNKENTKLYSPWIYVKEEDVSNNIAAVPLKAEMFCKENIKYCDDSFYNTTIIVEGAFIKLSDQYQVQDEQLDITKNGLLYVGGITNIDPTNMINVTLDYTQQVTAKIDGQDPLGYYKWYAYLNISRLRANDHTILIQSPKTDDLKSILTISEYIPTPVPTQVPIKYVRNELNDFVIVTNVPPAAKPTGTPIVVDASDKQFVPIVTEETGKPAPPGAVFIKPTETNIIAATIVTTPGGKLPLDPFVPIMSLIIIILVMNRKD